MRLTFAPVPAAPVASAEASAARSSRARWVHPDFWPLLAIAGCSCLLVFQVVLLGKLPDHFDYWLQQYVHLTFLHRALHQGEVPLWNPQLIAGTPHLADPQAAVLYPLTTLPLLVLSPATVARLSIPFHFLLAGAGAYGLARSLAIGRPGATVAALAYALAPHFAPLGVAIYIQQSAAWAPAIAWTLRAAFARASLPLFASAGALWALQLLSGYAQTWYVTGLCAAAWSLSLLFGRLRTGRGALRCLAGLALFAGVGLGLAAVQLLPSLELLQESQRGGGFSLAEASGLGRITLFNLLGIAGPDAEVSGAFPGGSVLALALAGLLYGGARGRWFFAGLAGVALALCLGSATPLWALCYRFVPGFATLHMPHRTLFLWSLALAVLAGYGAGALARRPGVGPLAVSCAGMAAALWLASVTVPGAPAGAGRGVIQLAGGMAALILVAAVPWRQVARLAAVRLREWSWLFPALVAADLLAFNLPRLYGAYYPPGPVYAPPPAAQWLQQQAGAAAASGAGPFRFASEPYGADSGDYGPKAQDNRRLAFLPPNTPALYGGLAAAQGYLAIRLTASGDYFNALNDLGRNPRVLSIYDPTSRLLDLLDVRYFVTGPSASYLSRVGGGLSLVAADGPKDVQIVEPRAATEIEVWSSLGDSTGVADGAPVGRLTLVDTSGGRQAITLLAGEHTAEWLYDTPGVAGTVRHRMAPIAHAEPRAGGGHTSVYRATFPLDTAPGAQLRQIQVEALHPAARLNVDRLLLRVPFDSRFRLAYDAPPVHIWENPSALPRAWWVGSYLVEPDRAAHLELLKRQTFDPRRQAALYEDPALGLPGVATGAALVAARIESQTNNTLRLDVDAPAPGLLVVSQAAAPGWQAQVDGQPAPTFAADGILQAIPVPAGAHQVTVSYVPGSVRLGAAISLVTLIMLAGWAGIVRLRRPFSSYAPQRAERRTTTTGLPHPAQS